MNDFFYYMGIVFSGLIVIVGVGYSIGIIGSYTVKQILNLRKARKLLKEEKGA